MIKLGYRDSYNMQTALVRSRTCCYSNRKTCQKTSLNLVIALTQRKIITLILTIKKISRFHFFLQVNLRLVAKKLSHIYIYIVDYTLL